MAEVEGTFTVAGWDESTAQELEPPAKLTRAAITQQFEGGLAAKGTAELVMSYTADGKASFAGYQRFEGELDGRGGTFVLKADGVYEEGLARTQWSVVAGSGTGRLAGLRGTGSSTVGSTPPGTYTLDYEVD